MTVNTAFGVSTPVNSRSINNAFDAVLNGGYDFSNIVATGTITAGGLITSATGFSGNGANLTALNATQLTSGTVPTARISGSYTGITTVGTLTALTTTGQVTMSRGALGTTAGNEIVFLDPNATTSNADKIDTRLIRGSNGTSWDTAFWRIGRLVDATRMGFIQFGDASSAQDVRFGIGSTVYGVVNTGGFSGAGSGLTSLNASQLTSGTVANARISGSYTGFSDITSSGRIHAQTDLRVGNANSAVLSSNPYALIVTPQGYTSLTVSVGESWGSSGISGASANFNIGASSTTSFINSANGTTAAYITNVDGEYYGRSNIRIFTAGANFIAQSPTTNSGNAAQWLSVFGLYILVRNTSTRNDKENFQPLNGIVTPSMIDDIEISLWNRKGATGFPEIGPMAEDMDEVSPFLSIRGMDCDEEGNIVATAPSGINQNSWLSLLTLSVQDIRKRLTELEAA